METKKPAHTPEVIFAVSHSADFEEGTYTFLPDKDFKVQAGRFAILLDSNYHQLKSQRDELLEVLKYVLTRIENSEEWWMDCPNKGGFDTEKIEAAIANAEKGVNP
jgi:hypothetical protein